MKKVNELPQLLAKRLSVFGVDKRKDTKIFVSYMNYFIKFIFICHSVLIL